MRSLRRETCVRPITRLVVAAGLLAGLALGCGGNPLAGDKGYGEPCEFVSGEQAPPMGGIEFSNISQCESGYCLAIPLLDLQHCTQPCQAEGDCPAGSQCLPMVAQGSFCLQVPAQEPCRPSELGVRCETGLPGVCERGTTACDFSGAEPVVVCRPDREAAERDEPDNYQDDDCDGETDEDPPAEGTPCVITDGSALGQCMEGTTDAQGVCRPTIQPGSQPEVCGEGLPHGDEDCDGELDESDPSDGELCDTGFPGVCGEGALRCRACTLVTVPHQLPETCDGRDEDCDGLTDEDGDVEGDVCRERILLDFADDIGDLAAAGPDALYVGLESRVLARVRADGSTEWSVSTDELGPARLASSPSGAVVLAHDGTTQLAAYDASGARLWHLGFETYHDIHDALVEEDGAALAVGMMRSPETGRLTPTLFAVAPDGTLASWIELGIEPSLGLVRVGADAVWVGGEQGCELRTRAGDLLWQDHGEAGRGTYQAPAVVAGERLVLASQYAEGVRLTAVEPSTGAELWRSEVLGATVCDPVVPRSCGELAVGSAGEVYVKAYPQGGRGQLHRVEGADGRVAWSVELRAQFVATAPVVFMAPDRVLARSDREVVRVVTAADGATVFEASAPETDDRAPLFLQPSGFLALAGQRELVFLR